MTTQEVEAPATEPEPSRRRSWRMPPAWRERTDLVPRDRWLGQVMIGLRWGAVAVWLGVVIFKWHRDGVPFDRTGLLLWLGLGLACLCIGYHPIWLVWVAVDFLPFVAVLVVYDRLRGWSYTAGFPTWWYPQIKVDRFLFFGHEPTIWLQEHLKYPDVRWWDVAVTLCYFSFFFLPYLLACVMWLRSRPDFYRWAVRFVGLSFIGFGLFVLIPAAPPWAAAQCGPIDVSDHPNNPGCMSQSAAFSDGGILGHYGSHVAGANGWVERISGRGFFKLHLSIAQTVLEHGQGWGDNVAAVPSLHVGGTVLFVLFMWRRVNKWWKPLLVAYPFAMMFSLAYGAEHYVADGIAGALCAWLVHWLADRGERWLKRDRPADTLDPPPETDQESTCLPTVIPNPALPPGTTPSST